MESLSKKKENDVLYVKIINFEVTVQTSEVTNIGDALRVSRHGQSARYSN